MLTRVDFREPPLRPTALTLDADPLTESQPKPLRRSVALGPLLRQAHLYLGMLIAPSILMFAVTGGLQIFRLQEAHPGYAPPPVIERLGRLHKDQVFTVAPPRRARSEAAGKAGPGRAAMPRRSIRRW